MPIPPNCVTTPNGIGINYNTYVVTPPNYCAEKGQDIEVRVTPRNGDVGTVTTEPKPDHPGWLAGTNDPDPNGFVLEHTDEEGEHDYNVIFSDGCIIDPRITI